MAIARAFAEASLSRLRRSSTFEGGGAEARVARPATKSVFEKNGRGKDIILTSCSGVASGGQRGACRWRAAVVVAAAFAAAVAAYSDDGESVGGPGWRRPTEWRSP